MAALRPHATLGPLFGKGVLCTSQPRCMSAVTVLRVNPLGYTSLLFGRGNPVGFGYCSVFALPPPFSPGVYMVYIYIYGIYGIYGIPWYHGTLGTWRQFLFWSDFVRFGQIWSDLVRFCQVWVRVGQIWSDLVPWTMDRMALQESWLFYCFFFQDGSPRIFAVLPAIFVFRLFDILGNISPKKSEIVPNGSPRILAVLLAICFQAF